VLVFNYREADRRAVVSWDAADQVTPWLGIVRDMMLQASKEARGEGAFPFPSRGGTSLPKGHKSST